MKKNESAVVQYEMAERKCERAEKKWQLTLKKSESAIVQCEMAIRKCERAEK